MRITIKDISRLASVSRATVYRALNNKPGINGKTKEKVLKIVQSFKYRPNRLGMGLAKKEKLKIGIITLPVKNPFSKKLMTGIEEAKEELNDFGVSFKVYSIQDLSPASQVQRILELLGEKVHGISIDVTDCPEVRQAVDLVIENNIPVVTFNSDLKGSRRLCFVGQDLYRSGQVAADLLCKFMDGKGRVFVLNGFHKFMAHKERLSGFRSILNQYNPKIQIVCIEESLDDNFIAYEKTCEVFSRYSDINGIYVVGAGTGGLGKAVKKFGKVGRIKIVCNDLVLETIQLLRQNVIDATIFQDPKSQGKLPIKILFDLLFENIQPSQDTYYTKTEIITKYLI